MPGDNCTSPFWAVCRALALWASPRLPMNCSLGRSHRQLFYGLPCQATCQATLGILAGCTPPGPTAVVGRNRWCRLPARKAAFCLYAHPRSLGRERLARARRQLHQPILGSLQSSRIGLWASPRLLWSVAFKVSLWNAPDNCSMGSRSRRRARQLASILAGCIPTAVVGRNRWRRLPARKPSVAAAFCLYAHLSREPWECQALEGRRHGGRSGARARRQLFLWAFEGNVPCDVPGDDRHFGWLRPAPFCRAPNPALRT